MFSTQVSIRCSSLLVSVLQFVVVNGTCHSRSLCSRNLCCSRWCDDTCVDADARVVGICVAVCGCDVGTCVIPEACVSVPVLHQMVVMLVPV